MMQQQLQQQIPNRGGMSVNNLRVRLSAKIQSRIFLNQLQVPKEEFTGSMCVDGGTNISLMERVFHVLEYTSRYVDMMGFASDVEAKQAQIASGVAVHTDVQGNMVLIVLNEAPYLPENAISLLSTNQAREHGVWVDDVLHRHGGTQKICASDINGAEFPLHIQFGLMELNLRYPTKDEIDYLPVV